MKDRAGEGARPLASVIVLTKDAGPLFDHVLDGLSSQDAPFAFETLVVDSGSSDGTRGRAAQRGIPVHPIAAREFHHAVTRNLGASLARGDYLVFLTQDAVPADARWLATLVDAVREDDRVAGSYSRVLPPAGCDPLTEQSVLGDINARAERIVQERGAGDAYHRLDPYGRRILSNFNDVSSCLRASVWSALPFPLTPFAEDLLWGLAAIEAGHRLVFEPRSMVRHGHRYNLKKLWQRTWIDGFSNRLFFDRMCLRSFPDAVRAARSLAARDWRGMRGKARPADFLRSPLHRLVEMGGLYAGGRRARPQATPVPSPARPLRVLLALHAFPPDTWAGTEVYTLTLARELRSRGHEVAIFHRVERAGAPSFSLEEREFDGFPAFGLVNNLDYRDIAETYVHAGAEEPFRRVLAAFRPDLVHFQHCLHTSSTLIGVARDSGAPAVVTLNDYWFLCPRVQLVRSDGSRCDYERPGVRCIRCFTGSSWAARAGVGAALAFAPVVPLALRARRALAGPPDPTSPWGQMEILESRRGVMLRALARANILVAPSRFLRDKYVAFGVEPRRILTLGYGIRGQGLRPASRTRVAGQVRFAFVGSLVPHKGPQILAEAFRLVPHAGARLAIHGDDASQPVFRSVRAQLESLSGGDPRIAFHGAFRNEDLPRIHAGVDILVVPSLWYENQPLVILEAFAAGVPVVASRLGALTELVRDGVDGLTFEPGLPGALARVLSRLLDDPGLIDRLRAGIPPVKEASLHGAEIETIYRQVLGER